MKAYPRVSLSDGVRKELERILRAGKSSVKIVFRAKIILLASEGQSNWLIMKKLNTTLNTVGKWVSRFTQNPIIQSLEDSPRSGRPFSIPAIAKCEIIKFACSDVRKILPDEGSWTIKSLQSCA